MLKYSCNNFFISLICNNIYLNAATNNRSTKERLKIRLIIFNSKIIVPFFFSSVHRSIIQILGFIAKIRTEFQSRSCLFVINTYYRYVHFSWKRWMDFPWFYQFHISTIFEGFLLDRHHRLSLHSLLTKKSWIIFSR